MNLLRREVFGFLPYWELGTTLDYNTLSTIAYFGVGINVDGMAKFVKDNGYDHSEEIVLFEGDILDGRHRHSICKKLGITPSFAEFVGKDAPGIACLGKLLA